MSMESGPKNNEKPDLWTEKVLALQKKGLLAKENHPNSYGYNSEAANIFSISEEDLQKIGDENLEDRKMNLKVAKAIATLSGTHFDEKISPFLRNNNILNEVRVYQQEIGSADKWWSLSKESKKEMLQKLGIQLPSGFDNIAGKMISKLGISKEEDWFDAAFINATALLSKRFEPYRELLHRGQDSN